MTVVPAEYQHRIHEAAEHLARELGAAPQAAICLGSGMEGPVRPAAPVRETLTFGQVPHFPVPTVAGHCGRIVLQAVGQGNFCCLEGRVHLYEGLSIQDVVFPVRALAVWGVKAFVLTNAAGGIGGHLAPGDLMLITDHLNLSGDNPLVGITERDFGGRFTDMSAAYSANLMEVAEQAAADLGQVLKRGIYAAVKGPSYETPAEIRMLRLLGADAVGMSTVPEVIALNQMGREVLGISLITNRAAGLQRGELNHHEVLHMAEASANRVFQLCTHIIERTLSCRKTHED